MKISGKFPVFLGIILSLVISICIASDAQAAKLDLTLGDESVTDGYAIFQRELDLSYSVGSGVFEPFVRVQKKGTEEGYNSDGSPLWEDTKGGTHTHSITLDYIPIVDIGGTNYREFELDINEGGKGSPNKMVGIDLIDIYLEATGSLTGDPSNDPPFTNLVYCLDADVDNWILLDSSLHKGSGNTLDMFAYIPASRFTGTTNQYVYFHSLLGRGEYDPGTGELILRF